MSNPPPNVPGDQPPGAQPGGWGASPPPPPSGLPPYGQQPYGQQPYGQQLPQFGQFGGPQSNIMAGMPGQLAEWPQRALGWLIDAIAFIGLWLVCYIISFAVGFFFSILGDLAALAVGIFLAYQLGTFGSTPGMRMIGLKCVNLKTGQPLGAGMGIARLLVHVVLDILCFIPYVVDMLFPLWDAQKQTLADKVVGSVVITVPKQPFSIMPTTA